MTEKKIRKVISRATVAKQTEETVEPKAETNNTETAPTAKSKRSCFFCQSGKKPSYTDMAVLKKYTTDRAKIVARAKSNVCSRHQRAVARHVKYARHLSLLPFIPRV